MTYKGWTALAQMRRDVLAATKRASYRSTIYARRYAEGITSGPWRTKELNREDNPYAKRHGSISGAVHPFWINTQTGKLENSWQVVNVNLIVNNTPYASYLWEGTRVMFGRPFVEEIQREWKRLRSEEVKRELALIGLPTTIT